MSYWTILFVSKSSEHIHMLPCCFRVPGFLSFLHDMIMLNNRFIIHMYYCLNKYHVSCLYIMFISQTITLPSKNLIKVRSVPRDMQACQNSTNKLFCLSIVFMSVNPMLVCQINHVKCFCAMLYSLHIMLLCQSFMLFEYLVISVDLS
jgi:hypothetical protein